MGQYYKAINLDKKQYIRPEMLKLMEHSWIGNDTLEAIELLMIKGALWDKCRIVWGGDYADDEKENSLFYNNIEANTLYSQCGSVFTELTYLITVSPQDHVYLVNFDKKLYVNKEKVPSKDTWNDGTPMQIHPLPLLTAEGNGRGGGDFYGSDPDNIIGSWARDRIGLRNKIPKGFEELFFNLTE